MCPQLNVCSYLQLVCLAENVRLELDDICSLIRLARADVRRCLLQLQLWVLSSGGWAVQNRPSPKEPHHTHCEYQSGPRTDTDFVTKPFSAGTDLQDVSPFSQI